MNELRDANSVLRQAIVAPVRGHRGIVRLTLWTLMALTGCAKPTATSPNTEPPAPSVGIAFPSSDPPALQEQPAWSATGLLAYRDNGVVCVHEGYSFKVDPSLVGIWILDPSHGTPTLAAPNARNPSWSANGRWLAYELSGQLWIASGDGSAPRAAISGGSLFFPALNADGTQVAFDADWDGTGYKIWVAKSDGSDAHPLGWSGSGAQRMASWSRDGTSLLCIAYPENGPTSAQVFEVAADGTWHRQLTVSPSEKRNPCYSPDGRQIAFTAILPGKAPQVWCMSLSGDSVRQITHQGGVKATWSPDGRSIAYSGLSGSAPQLVTPIIWEQDLATSETIQITHPWPKKCE